MAKILHNDAAPSEKVHYSFAGVEFELSGKAASFESDDASVLSNAESHPWLKVEYPKAELLKGLYVSQLDPRKDPLSSFNSIANNPDEVRKALEARADEATHLVALDAGLKQTDVVESGGVAETLAADDTSKTSAKGKK